MSLASQIEAAVERGTYLAVSAGLLAESLLQSANPKDYEDDAETTALITAMVALLHGRILDETAALAQQVVKLTGGETLSNKMVNAIIEDTLANSIAIVEERLQGAVAELRSYLTRLADYGLSEEAMQAALTTDATAKALVARIASVLRQGASGIVSSVEAAILEAAQVQRVAQAATEPGWVWITVQDGRVCSGGELISCAPRHGVSRTLDQWSQIGLPKAPNLICTMFSRSGLSNCRCFLADAETALADEIANGTPALDVSAAVARGKQAATSGAA